VHGAGERGASVGSRFGTGDGQGLPFKMARSQGNVPQAIGTSRRPNAPMPSLVIHLTAAVAPAAPAASGVTPTAFSRLLVARLWLIQPCTQMFAFT